MTDRQVFHESVTKMFLIQSARLLKQNKKQNKKTPTSPQKSKQKKPHPKQNEKPEHKQKRFKNISQVIN